MTTSASRHAPAPELHVPGAALAPPPLLRAAGWAAAAGTLPYLALKTVWLTGGTTGVTDPAFLADPTIGALNAVTLAMDLVVIVLALALTHRWGERIPVWLVLLPMWVGTGFLVPMAVSILPATLVSAVAAGAATNAALEPWVQPLVYGGFAWQGVFLAVAFAGHARRRWGAAVAVPAPPARALAPLLRVIAGGGTAMAALSAGLHVAFGLGTGDPVAIGVETINAALAVAGAVGVLALARGRGIHRWSAVAAGWTGSAAMFSWGLYTAVITMADTPFDASHPVGGMAQLTGLLGGFALAVAGLLALAGTGVARPQR
ncbi:hypothetical protein [Pseudonocardia nigra]|uniref:hypothetical protein n=1 Tax=Pseudonocardia nigra TaxID=1921578 RepID=UPI001C5FD326|nr:hypothetical protein [Pseudonocardia nigra]